MCSLSFNGSDKVRKEPGITCTAEGPTDYNRAMDAAERSSLVAQLRNTRDLFLQTVAGVSDGQATFKPGSDRWSILEIAEHLAIAEQGMYRLITTHCEPLDRAADRTREAGFLNPDRSRRLEAPERVRPKGRYSSLLQALDQFIANRERTIDYVDTCEDDLRKRATNHAVGRISCQECLMLLISHPARHVEQIREIKNSSGFPA